jgi:hypothetical protein
LQTFNHLDQVPHRKDAKAQRKRKGKQEKHEWVKNIRSGLFVDEWSVRFDVPFCADQIFAQSSSSLRFLCAFAPLRLERYT